MSDRLDDLYRQTQRLGPVPGLEPRLEDLALSRMLVERGLVSEEAVTAALEEQERALRTGTAPLPRLSDLLESRGIRIQEPPAKGGEGDRLGPYVKVQLLGRGAFGEVWKALDTKLSRHVALKVMRQREKDEDEFRRFMREAQTAASLSHPNIASVYQVGQDAGRHFIAMQLVDGQTLQTAPRHDVREVARIVRDAARAVGYAHEKGVIHRDLKPANIMLDRGGRVFVMDFGLAKRTDVKSSLSVAGGVLGTPAYMSPEQARSENVNARGDVYSLGATLYEMLADRPVFRADDVMALLGKVATEEPVPVRRRNARVPRDLETIAMKCIEKDARRRYANATELADDLTRFLDGEAILAHPPSFVYRLRKRLAKHRALTASLAAGLVGVAAVIAILLPRLLRSERELNRRLVLKPLEDALRDAKPYFYIPGADIRQKLSRVEKELDALAKDDPDDAEICSVMGYGWYLAGDFERAERVLRRALDDDAAHPRASHVLGRVLAERALARGAAVPKEATALFAAARAGWPGAEEIDRAVAEGFHALACDRLDDVAAICEKARGRDGIGTEDLSMLRAVSGPAGDRAGWLRKAIQRRPHYGWAHLMLGSELLGASPDEAIAHFDAALRCNPRDDTAHLRRGIARETKGLTDDALADYDAAARLRPDDPDVLFRRGRTLLSRGDRAAAAADLERALSRAPAGWPDRAAAKAALADAKR